MTYDLSFTVRPGEKAPEPAELGEWFRARPHWMVGERGAGYANDATGTSFQVSFRENGPEDEPDRAPVSLTIAGRSPHTVALEAEEEMRAFVERFRLLVNDPQIDGMGKGEFSTEKFISGFAAFNKLAHQVCVMLDQEIHAVPKVKLEAAWRWNRGVEALAKRSGDSIFVPKVLFAPAKKKGIAETLVAWAEGIPARVPEVDSIQGARGRIAWSDLGPALALAKREESPLPHWLFGAAAAAQVAETVGRVQRGAPPRILSMGDVSTAELVALVRGEPEAEETKPAPKAKAKKPAPKARAKKPAPKAKRKPTRRPKRK